MASIKSIKQQITEETIEQIALMYDKEKCIFKRRDLSNHIYVLCDTEELKEKYKNRINGKDSIYKHMLSFSFNYENEFEVFDYTQEIKNNYEQLYKEDWFHMTIEQAFYYTKKRNDSVKRVDFKRKVKGYFLDKDDLRPLKVFIHNKYKL